MHNNFKRGRNHKKISASLLEKCKTWLLPVVTERKFSIPGQNGKGPFEVGLVDCEYHVTYVPT